MARLPPERDIGVMRSPARSNLGLVGVFIVVVFAVAVLDRVGANPGFAPFAIVGAALALFVLVALSSHSRRASDFYVADRRATPKFNGLAGASGIAGLLAVGLAVGAYETLSGFILAGVGLALGHLVLGSVIAPRLHAFGAYTAGDFIAARFGRTLVRLVWAGITFAVSLMLFIAALKITAPLVATLFDIEPTTALYATAALMALASFPGGMRSLSWTQAIQYLVIAIACVVPAGFFAAGGPTAQGVIAEELASALAESLPVWGDSGTVGWALPILLGTLGAAALPQVSARALTAPTGREALTSMIWAALFSILLLLAGFALFEFLGETVQEQSAGGAATLATIVATLPSIFSGLVLAGILAALFSLGQAALFAAATAISHDVWDEIIDRRGTEGRRIVVSRLILVGVTVGAVSLASLWRADAAALVAWALALAAAGCFMPLVLGLWWRRCNDIGAIGGMVAGFGFTGLVFLLQQHLIPDSVVASGWAGVGAPVAAAAATLLSLVAMIGLSLATPAPDKDSQILPERRERRRGRWSTRERPA